MNQPGFRQRASSFPRISALWLLTFALSASACGSEPARDGQGGHAPDGAAPDAGDGDGDTGDGDLDGRDASAGEDTEDSGTPGPGDTVSLVGYCESVATRFFAYRQRCSGSDLYPDAQRASFVAEREADCLVAGPALQAGRFQFDAAQAARCLAYLDKKGTSCVGEFLDADACRGIFAGAVAVGEACFAGEGRHLGVSTSTCAAGFCGGGDSCPSSCEAFAARGASCDNKACAPEDYCNSDSLRCTARIALGESCADAAGGCAVGLLCRNQLCVKAQTEEGAACGALAVCSGGGSSCVDGHCRSKLELGQPCLVRAQCPAGAVCADDENNVRVCMTPRGQGGACTRDGEISGRSQCASPLVCLSQGGANVGACGANPLPGEGDSCVDDGVCQSGLWCSSSGCRKPSAQGGTCELSERSSCMEWLSCDPSSRLCVPPAAQDGACNARWTNSCQWGLGCACSDSDRDSCDPYNNSPEGRCKPLVAVGGSCFRDAECQSQRCEFDTTKPATQAGLCKNVAPACYPAAL